MLLKPVSSQSADIITHDGISKTLRQWSVYLGLPYDTLRMRYRRGLRGDELFKQKQHYEKRGAYERSLLAK
jgi:hypothetical protein